MIFGSTLTPVNHAVTVLVHKLDVARTINESVALELGLAGYVIIIDPLASCRILACEVAEIEVAVGLEAPDLAILLARVVSVNQVVAVPLSNLSLVVTDVESSIEVNIAKATAPVESELPTTSAQ